MTEAPEFSRPLRVDQIGDGRSATITAEPEERAALARRFVLVRLDRLEADYRLRAVAGGWQAEGRMRADAVQPCIATGQDVPATLDLPFAIRFVEEGTPEAEELELSEEDCDTVAVDDGRIDMGEAIAQTLALNLDPYPRAPDADAFLRAAGVKSEDESGPLSGLADLLKGGAKKG